MAANPKSPMGAGPMLEESHIYHAEATIFSGHLSTRSSKRSSPTAVVLENTRAKPSSPVGR